MTPEPLARAVVYGALIRHCLACARARRRRSASRLMASAPQPVTQLAGCIAVRCVASTV